MEVALENIISVSVPKLFRGLYTVLMDSEETSKHWKTKSGPHPLDISLNSSWPTDFGVETQTTISNAISSMKMCEFQKNI